MTLLALIACAPSSPAWVVREPADLSYATGDLWRVDVDACGFDATTTMTAYQGGTVVVESHLGDEAALAVVDERCDEADWGPLAPGAALDVDLYVGDVIRVYDAAGERRSAWELAFPYGATLVLRW